MKTAKKETKSKKTVAQRKWTKEETLKLLHKVNTAYGLSSTTNHWEAIKWASLVMGDRTINSCQNRLRVVSRPFLPVGRTISSYGLNNQHSIILYMISSIDSGKLPERIYAPILLDKLKTKTNTESKSELELAEDEVEAVVRVNVREDLDWIGNNIDLITRSIDEIKVNLKSTECQLPKLIKELQDVKRRIG